MFMRKITTSTARLATSSRKVVNLNLTKSFSTTDISTKTEPVEDKGVLARLGLDDWKFALPVGLMVGIPTVGNEVLVLGPETQLTACFILFCATMYHNVGGMIAGGLDEYRSNVFTQLKAVDDSMLVDIHASITANEKVLGLESDITSIHELTDELSIMQAEALNNAEQHHYREAIIKKLNTLVSLEESASAAIRARMLTQVKAEVVANFTSNKASKEASLNAAIAVLAGGKNAKLGKDIVGEAFTSSLKGYRESYSKLKASDDEILVQLEKDMKATMEAPKITCQGGNVYTTHPIIG